jgi:hypothetical protein
LALAFGIIFGAGLGYGGSHYFRLLPLATNLVNQVNILKQEKAALASRLDQAAQDRTAAQEEAEQLEALLQGAHQELTEVRKSVQIANDGLAGVQRECESLRRARAAAEQERDLLKHELTGSLALALTPKLLVSDENWPALQTPLGDPVLRHVWGEYFARVEDSYSAVIRTRPDHARAHALRAWTRHARAADPVEVFADLDRALELDTDRHDPVVQFVSARIYERTGKSREAAERMALAAQASGDGNPAGFLIPVALAARRQELVHQAALSRALNHEAWAQADTLRLLERALEQDRVQVQFADRARLCLARAKLLTASAKRLQSAGCTPEAAQSFEVAAQGAAEAAEIARTAQLDLAAEAYDILGSTLELLGRYRESLEAFEAGRTWAREPSEHARFAAACVRVRMALPMPDLNRTLEEAELAIQESQGKSSDAFYAKAIALNLLKQHRAALDSLLSGAAVIHPSSNVTPDLFLRALADTYHRTQQQTVEQARPELDLPP